MIPLNMQLFVFLTVFSGAYTMFACGSANIDEPKAQSPRKGQSKTSPSMQKGPLAAKQQESFGMGEAKGTSSVVKGSFIDLSKPSLPVLSPSLPEPSLPLSVAFPSLPASSPPLSIPSPSVVHANVVSFARGDLDTKKSLPLNGEYVEHKMSFPVIDLRHSPDSHTLQRNGFQLVNFANTPYAHAVDALLRQLGDAALVKKDLSSPSKVDLAIAAALPAFEKAFGDWILENKTNLNTSAAVTHVVCGVGAYRDTSGRSSGKSSSQIPMFHIDLAQADSSLFDLMALRDRVLRTTGHSELSDITVLDTFNIWMPLSAVHSTPLALIDTTTLGSESLAQFEMGAPSGDGRTFITKMPKYRPEIKAYYFSGMQRLEALVFKTFETPHAAIGLPTDKPEGRQSIDIRCFLLSAS
jgi:hypothetical protein